MPISCAKKWVVLLMLVEDELTSEKMAEEVGGLFDEGSPMLEMKEAIRRFKEKTTSDDMCALIKRLIPKKRGDG
jgi:UDP-N-acetylglucosamine:LPS N-acetylglucosamine transferase